MLRLTCSSSRTPGLQATTHPTKRGHFHDQAPSITAIAQPASCRSMCSIFLRSARTALKGIARQQDQKHKHKNQSHEEEHGSDAAYWNHDSRPRARAIHANDLLLPLTQPLASLSPSPNRNSLLISLPRAPKSSGIRALEIARGPDGYNRDEPAAVAGGQKARK